MEQEDIIKKYFAAWLNKDDSVISDIMSKNIIYSECYGPEYQGINQVLTWFVEWNQCGTVLKWDIKQFIHQDNITVVEWYFECNYNNVVDGFDGISLVEFDAFGKIQSIKEFQSKSEHNFPYGKENAIKIRALHDHDVDLFAKWLYTPHVARWYHEPEDWLNEIKNRHSEFSWVHHFIVESNDKPIGFCQYYEYKNGGETWHGDIDMEGTYSIDYMIGEANYLGKGLGKQIIKSLIDKISLCDNAKRIIVQPEPENMKSCGTLLSCDFTFDEQNELYVLEL